MMKRTSKKIHRSPPDSKNPAARRAWKTFQANGVETITCMQLVNGEWVAEDAAGTLHRVPNETRTQLAEGGSPHES